MKNCRSQGDDKIGKKKFDEMSQLEIYRVISIYKLIERIVTLRTHRNKITPRILKIY